MNLENALALIRDAPDFPSPGITFKDITPLLSSAPAFEVIVQSFGEHLNGVELIAGIEARGFIFGAAIAAKFNLGFVPIRKAGKLPFTTHRQSYGLEYGQDVIEVHTDAFTQTKDGEFGGAAKNSVLIVDDVLATGGTLSAAIDLVKRGGGEIKKIIVLLEISFLSGRELIALNHPEIEVIAIKAI